MAGMWEAKMRKGGSSADREAKGKVEGEESCWCVCVCTYMFVRNISDKF